MRTHAMNEVSNPVPAPRGAGTFLLLALVALLFGAFSFVANPALAQSDDMPKLGIRPADSDAIFFTEEMKAGTSKELKVEISNHGSASVKVLTYASDVYSLVNGGLGVKLEDEPDSGTTTWLEYPEKKFKLEKGKGKTITFSATVPEGTAPGQYVTSLVIQNADAIKGNGGVAFNQILRQAIAVAITVPGKDEPKLSLGSVHYQDNPLIDSIQVDITNAGNLHLKPAGTLRIVNAAGDVVLDTPVAMDSVYAGTSTILEVGLSQPLPAGEYKATVDLKDDKTGAAADLTDVAFTVAETKQVSTAPAVTALDVQPVRASADGPIQMAAVTVTVNNPGATIEDGQVMLHVERDGQLVEDYPLTMPGKIAPGEATFQARYMPLTGWLPGSYSFTAVIVGKDPATGTATKLATSDAPVVLEVK